MIKNKTLFIDGQVFQTAARDRGMGRYVYELLRNLPKKQIKFQEIVFIFNQNKSIEKDIVKMLKSINSCV